MPHSPCSGVYLPRGEMGKANARAVTSHSHWDPNWVPNAERQCHAPRPRLSPVLDSAAGGGGQRSAAAPARAGISHGLCGSAGRFGDKKPIRVHKPREATLGLGIQASPALGGWGKHACEMTPHACPALALLETEFGVRGNFASCV